MRAITIRRVANGFVLCEFDDLDMKCESIYRLSELHSMFIVALGWLCSDNPKLTEAIHEAVRQVLENPSEELQDEIARN